MNTLNAFKKANGNTCRNVQYIELAVNKLEKCIEEQKERVIFKEINKKIIKISAKTQDGVDELLSNMVKMVSNEDIKADGELLVINVRHKGLIAKAKDALQKAIDTINSGMPIDVIAIYMKDILAKRLKKCRAKTGLPQIKVAVYCDITEKAYQNYELGVHEPKVSILMRIARFYGVSIDYLVGLTDDPTPYPRAPE